MWNKYDKLDLKSQNYKARRTPEKQYLYNSRSPNHNSNVIEPLASAQTIHPQHLFQKVCCPNCRYLFKIIKNTELLRSLTPQKLSVTTNVAIQTEFAPLTISLPVTSSLPKNNHTFVNSLSESSRMSVTPKKEQSVIFKTSMIRHNNTSKSPNKEPDHLKESTYQFPDKISRTYNKSTKKLTQSHLSHAGQHPKHSSRKSSGRFDKKDPKYLQDAPEPDRYLIEKMVRQQIRKDLAELPSLISLQLANTQAVDHLTNFYLELPEAVEVPSYFKMLVSDYSSGGDHATQYYKLSHK